MGLFPKEQSASGAVLGDAPARMAWTREQGTRRLLLAFVAVVAVWFVVGKVRDYRLLKTPWPVLKPDVQGLSVAGILNGRSNYGRNLFHVIESNKTSRVILTDFGFRTIFDGQGGPLFSEKTGKIIMGAISVDSQTGYRMLEPFLKVGVARILGEKNPEHYVSEETPVLVAQGGKEKPVALGSLLAKYAEGAREAESGGDSEGESLGQRDVETGTTIPGENLLQACPIILTGAHFEDAWLDERDEPLTQRKTYLAHLGLTREGRSRFFQWSHDHANEHIAFILNGTIVTAARIKMTMDVNVLEIGPMRSKDSAEALVNSIRKEK